mgnify:FL=1
MERPLRLLSVLLAVGAVATLVLGAAGFTTVEANRTVDVAVVDDDEAYIGIPEKVELNSEPIAKNRFATDVKITAKIAVPAGQDGDIVVDQKTLRPGHAAVIERNVDSGKSMDVTFDENTVGNETKPLPEHISIELTDVQGDNIEASVGERTVEVE